MCVCGRKGSRMPLYEDPWLACSAIAPGPFLGGRHGAHQIDDCKAAVRWLRANAKKYNLDRRFPSRLGGSQFSWYALCVTLAKERTYTAPRRAVPVTPVYFQSVPARFLVSSASG
jgi:hypothetical protein